jgi:hypothetical protein
MKSNFLGAFLNISLITLLDTAVQCKSTTTMFLQIILKVVIYLLCIIFQYKVYLSNKKHFFIRNQFFP